MDMLIPGLCGLVVIIGLVAVVMSRSNWSVPQMVLVGCILVASLVFFYFSARAFVLAKNWNDEIKKYDDAIDVVVHGRTAGNQVVERGNEQLKQVRDKAKDQIEVAVAGRGRAWREVGMVRTNPDTGEITVSVDEPTPHGIATNTTLYVFEQRDKGKYLGEFTVTAARDGDKLVKMVPALALSQRELNDISAVHGRLELYEIMPADSHALFAQLDNRDETIKAAFPPDVVGDYLRDDKPSDNDFNYRWMKFTKDWSSPNVPAEKPAAGASPAGAPAPGAAPATGATATPPSAFKAGDVALFDAKTAEELKTKGVADYDANDPEHPNQGKVFRRELRDYADLFRTTIRQRSELIGEVADVTAQAGRVDAAKNEVLADVDALQKERDGLKSDLARFRAESEIATKFVDAIAKRNEELRVELSKTFRDNIRTAGELDRLIQSLHDSQTRGTPPVQSEASLAAPVR